MAWKQTQFAGRLTGSSVNDQLLGFFGHLGSRLFISIRRAASCAQPKVWMRDPRGARWG